MNIVVEGGGGEEVVCFCNGSISIRKWTENYQFSPLKEIIKSESQDTGRKYTVAYLFS